MDVKLTLSLPRDARYVSMLRRIAGNVLDDVAVPSEAAEDVALALSEACANAVRHAAGVAEYSVSVTVDERCCEVEIIDLGPGFDLAGEPPEHEDESGRGIGLMRALVDDLEFDRDPGGTRVRLFKRWDVRKGNPADGVHETAARPGAAGGSAGG